MLLCANLDPIRKNDYKNLGLGRFQNSGFFLDQTAGTRVPTKQLLEYTSRGTRDDVATRSCTTRVDPAVGSLNSPRIHKRIHDEGNTCDTSADRNRGVWGDVKRPLCTVVENSISSGQIIKKKN